MRPSYKMLRAACSAARELRTIAYAGIVNALEAHVRNGRIIVDESVDLPDGAELRVYLYDVAADSMSVESQPQWRQDSRSRLPRRDSS
jgi:uncharacterized lipoprotein YbaY